jgi:hypothetical protein
MDGKMVHKGQQQPWIYIDDVETKRTPSETSRRGMKGMLMVMMDDGLMIGFPFHRPELVDVEQRDWLLFLRATSGEAHSTESEGRILLTP